MSEDAIAEHLVSVLRETVSKMMVLEKAKEIFEAALKLTQDEIDKMKREDTRRASEAVGYIEKKMLEVKGIGEEEARRIARGEPPRTEPPAPRRKTLSEEAEAQGKTRPFEMMVSSNIMQFVVKFPPGRMPFGQGRCWKCRAIVLESQFLLKCPNCGGPLNAPALAGE